MKTFKLLFLGLLLTSFGAFAQYGNSMYNNMYNKNYGVNRNIGRNYSEPKKATPEEIEKNRELQLDKLMEKLKEELTLDDLQVIAIRNEVSNNSKNIDIVVKKETSEDEKSKEINSMMERTNKNINSYLNPVQKDKYKAFIENGQKKKEKKGKKENKKEDINTEEIKSEE